MPWFSNRGTIISVFFLRREFYPLEDQIVHVPGCDRPRGDQIFGALFGNLDDRARGFRVPEDRRGVQVVQAGDGELSLVLQVH